jgi:hypothetical protein
VGLLDDAIREHLDLKRRRGADPAEIERAEREALGPVRRNRDPNAAEDPEAAADLEPAVGSALDEPDEGVASDLAEEPYGEEELYEDELEPASVPADTYIEEDEELDDQQPVEEDEAFAAGDDPFADEEDPHRTQVMQTVDIPAPEDATAQHDVERTFADEDARGAEPPAAEHPAADDEGEDVLEETPEFLQDTPDHDRLWFEQRPPRDFDFDG